MSPLCLYDFGNCRELHFLLEGNYPTDCHVPIYSINTFLHLLLLVSIHYSRNELKNIPVIPVTYLPVTGTDFTRDKIPYCKETELKS